MRHRDGLLLHLYLLPSAMSSGKLSAGLKEILVCPACHGALEEKRDQITCRKCAHTFALKDGVPVFLPEPIELAPPNHNSNPIGAEFEEILRQGNDFVLNIGAGGTAVRYPNCIEFEHKIFRHTDVVGDAHHLPFRDNVFDRVFAFNVFEHLTEPKKAASEILRVLKPGGAVAVHTAFLQALHEEPFHFFNATEFGVRQWFSNYEIEACHVSGNFGPGVMLAFLLSNVVDAVRAADSTWKEQTLLNESTIGEWAEFWRTRGEQPPGFQTLQNLPQATQKKIAAGFELIARKPGVTVP
jgi:SAM-dependent methyltransferase